MDTSLVHADIFFLITTITEVVVGIALTVALVYVIKILRDVDKLNKRLQIEANEILDDVHDFRQKIKSEGVIVRHVMKYVMGLVYKTGKRVGKIKKNLTEE